jgi:phage terminase large subunit
MIGQSNVKGVAVGQVCQFVGREIRLLDYIEGVGQPLGFYATELRRRGWKNAVIHLPHDGVAHNNISGKRYIDHWVEAGFECADPIKNTGAGAAMMRIEAARRIFPRCWFNAKTVLVLSLMVIAKGIASSFSRNVGLGPEHDLAMRSNAASVISSRGASPPAMLTPTL